MYMFCCVVICCEHMLRVILVDFFVTAKRILLDTVVMTGHM